LLHGVGLLEGLLSGCGVTSTEIVYSKLAIRVTFEVGATLSIEWAPIAPVCSFSCVLKKVAAGF